MLFLFLEWLWKCGWSVEVRGCRAGDGGQGGARSGTVKKFVIMSADVAASVGGKPVRRLVIACGGTGGHLFPGIAVAQEAGRRGWETMLLISEKQIDALAVQGHQELRFEKVPAVAMPGVFSLKFPGFLWRVWRTRAHCRGLLKSFGADAVLGMGGFTSLPPVWAGKGLGLRTFVHESNAVPGKANRLTARFCTGVLLGLEACAKFFPAGKTQVTGTPLRTALLTRPDRAEALRFFGLSEGKKTVLVMGGSQGARGVNRAMVEALPMLAAQGVQVLHITGPKEYDGLKAAYDASPVEAAVVPFCQEMGLAYAAADVAVSRSGASSLTELSAFGLPVILVPYPTAADDHQRRNADVFTAAKAAVAVEEAELGGGKLGDLLTALLADEAERQRLGEAMKTLAPADAAARVCDAVAGV
ncbi:MAG: UDP-N-acetylglucosamine--N-acetylmuramyl-(pentapeptide) pyrophosphoryl-undecaprenol [Verrucomicrobiales bacterium]|nr:UDP-N-acetylglucosamine--N-acetylmuramyl-(pentapeptide) pyrophosphoryl-undecaprenol [Verrucomicrobiales bacterium]